MYVPIRSTATTRRCPFQKHMLPSGTLRTPRGTFRKLSVELCVRNHAKSPQWLVTFHPDIQVRRDSWHFEWSGVRAKWTNVTCPGIDHFWNHSVGKRGRRTCLKLIPHQDVSSVHKVAEETKAKAEQDKKVWLCLSLQGYLAHIKPPPS